MRCTHTIYLLTILIIQGDYCQACAPYFSFNNEFIEILIFRILKCLLHDLIYNT